MKLKSHEEWAVALAKELEKTKVEGMRIIRAVAKLAGDALASGQPVGLHEVLVIEPRLRPATVAYNPADRRQKVAVPSRWRLRMRTSKSLLARLNG